MAAKIEIPAELKKDLPQSKWGKVLGATPIIMTVIATMLAGLASSEMTKAQYDRSLAAQLQSKAGDQWSYFQAKKLRCALLQNTLELLEATVDLQPLDLAKLPVTLNTETLAALQKGKIPFDFASFQLPPQDQAALDAIANSKSEGEINDALVKLTDRNLSDDLSGAKMQTLTFEKVTKPINQAIEQLGKSLNDWDKSADRDFKAAKMRYNAARYDAESKMNATIANIYELQVRKGNISAERHHKRSGKFFIGMLAAQMAVIISTFSIAARQKSFLWSLAAAAGAAAVSFSLYVYLYV